MAQVNARRNGLSERCDFAVADLYQAGGSGDALAVDGQQRGLAATLKL